MHDCIFKLLRAGDEESLESMCKLLFTIGKYLADNFSTRIIIIYMYRSTGLQENKHWKVFP